MNNTQSPIMEATQQNSEAKISQDPLQESSSEEQDEAPNENPIDEKVRKALELEIEKQWAVNDALTSELQSLIRDHKEMKLSLAEEKEELLNIAGVISQSAYKTKNDILTKKQVECDDLQLSIFHKASKLVTVISTQCTTVEKFTKMTVETEDLDANSVMEICKNETSPMLNQLNQVQEIMRGAFDASMQVVAKQNENLDTQLQYAREELRHTQDDLRLAEQQRANAQSQSAKSLKPPECSPSPRSPDLIEACDVCGRTQQEVKLKHCNRCKHALYCGTECQKIDWKRGHKHKCGHQ